MASPIFRVCVVACLLLVLQRTEGCRLIRDKFPWWCDDDEGEEYYASTAVAGDAQLTFKTTFEHTDPTLEGPESTSTFAAGRAPELQVVKSDEENTIDSIETTAEIN